MSMTLPIQSGCFHASVMSGNQIEAFERKPLTSVNLWYHILAHSITRFGSVSGTGSTSNDVSTLSSMSSECFPPCVWNDHELSLDMWLASPSQGLLDDFLCHPRHPRHPRAKCVRQNAQLAASCTQIILNSSSHKNQLAAMAHWCPNLYWYIYIYVYTLKWNTKSWLALGKKLRGQHKYREVRNLAIASPWSKLLLIRVPLYEQIRKKWRGNRPQHSSTLLYSRISMHPSEGSTVHTMGDQVPPKQLQWHKIHSDKIHDEIIWGLSTRSNLIEHDRVNFAI